MKPYRQPIECRRRPVVLAAVLLALALSAAGARAAEALIAVAANFAQPMQRIAAGFTAATGHTLKLSIGATGKFYAQIRTGAPFAVLLAADAATPRKLIAEGHAVPGSSFSYATGRLVLWSARPGFVDDQGAVLAGGHFEHLAIANPKVAPYGAAALEMLRARGLDTALAGKLVTGESVGQAFQFVASGNAELGFVARSQITVPGQAAVGSHWLVPQALHAPIRQDAVLLRAGEGNPAAQALLAYLRSPPARELIAAFGYDP